MTTYDTGSAALDSARMRFGMNSIVADIAVQTSKDNFAEDGVLTSVPFKREPLHRFPPARDWLRPSNRPARPDVDVPFAV